MRASFYECDITPPLGGYIMGHYKKVLGEDVLDCLYAKALVIEDEGDFAAIVAVDTLSIPEEMHEIVTKRIFDYTEISPECVCISSNHTHKGAPVFDSPEINCFADAAYRDVFFRRVADAVILAYKRLGDEPVTVKFGKIEVPGIGYNRDGITEDGRLVTHVRGKKNIKAILGQTDPELSVIGFEKNGKLIGAIMNFACHQDCTGSVQSYSGDYSSVMAKELKEVYGNDFVSLFLLGTCGDINNAHYDTATPKKKHQTIGKTLAEAARIAMADGVEIGSGVAVVKEIIKIKRRIADAEYLAKAFHEWDKVGRLRNLLYYHASNDKEFSELYVQAIRIGNTCIYVLPGEMFVQSGLRIKAESPYENSIVVENSNSYCGYVPTENAFGENSDLYEASLCYHSCLVPEAGNLLTEKALELGEKLK